MADQLQQAIAAARGGRKAEARTLLMAIVAEDEHNAQAWLWLSGVVEDPADMRLCLENVLELDPTNTQARQGLDWVLAKYPELAMAPEPPLVSELPRVSEPVVNITIPSTPVISMPPEPVAPAGAPESAAPATPPRPAGPVPDARLSNDPLLCPYCGVQTSITQDTCPSCRQSLMVRGAVPAKPSRSHGLLVRLWQLSTLGWVVVALYFALAALLAYQAQQFSGVAAQRSPLALATVVVAALLPLGATLVLARQVQLRTPWARLVVLVAGVVLGLAWLATILVLPTLGAWLAEAAVPTALIAPLRVVGAVFLGSIALVYLAAAAFAARCDDDFEGVLERFRASVQPTDATTHYNTGLAYKWRGMWHMAVREWEAGRLRAPNDINLLRGLALAYARLGTLDRAKLLLDHALRVAPENALLRDDLAVIEQQARS